MRVVDFRRFRGRSSWGCSSPSWRRVSSSRPRRPAPAHATRSTGSCGWPAPCSCASSSLAASSWSGPRNCSRTTSRCHRRADRDRADARVAEGAPWPLSPCTPSSLRGGVSAVPLLDAAERLTQTSERDDLRRGVVGSRTDSVDPDRRPPARDLRRADRRRRPGRPPAAAGRGAPAVQPSRGSSSSPLVVPACSWCWPAPCGSRVPPDHFPENGGPRRAPFGHRFTGPILAEANPNCSVGNAFPVSVSYLPLERGMETGNPEVRAERRDGVIERHTRSGWGCWS